MPYKHAQHYLGWSQDRPTRIQQHLDGDGSPLIRAAVLAGIQVTWVQLFAGDRTLERRLKNRGTLKKVCLVCKPGYNKRAARHMAMTRRQRLLFSEWLENEGWKRGS